mgnify:CR=1 FL=1
MAGLWVRALVTTACAMMVMTDQPMTGFHVSEGNATDGNGEVDPHEQSLGEYEVGHSTVTYIIDKQLRKRVAYSGIYWDADNFLQDVITLSDE